MKLNIDDLGVVGIIVEDWDITKEFKPKTITTDYSSWICYISRRPVPSNIPITDNYYWKPIGRLRSDLAFDYNRFKENIESLVYSFIHTSESGVAFANEFGDNKDIGVNQFRLTKAFDKIWNKLEEITGEHYRGFVFNVTPPYYIGEDSFPISIEANTLGVVGNFEKVKIYIDDVLVAEDSDVERLVYNTVIDKTVVIKCEAKILGIPYEQRKTITRYDSFFVGCSTNYTNIMNLEHIVILKDKKANVNISCSDGDNIFIVLAKSLRDWFIRADMSGVEIEFSESEVTINNKQYVVFTSNKTYQTGTYNIDINS